MELLPISGKKGLKGLTMTLLIGASSLILISCEHATNAGLNDALTAEAKIQFVDPDATITPGIGDLNSGTPEYNTIPTPIPQTETAPQPFPDLLAGYVMSDEKNQVEVYIYRLVRDDEVVQYGNVIIIDLQKKVLKAEQIMGDEGESLNNELTNIIEGIAAYLAENSVNQQIIDKINLYLIQTLIPNETDI